MARKLYATLKECQARGAPPPQFFAPEAAAGPPAEPAGSADPPTEHSSCRARVQATGGHSRTFGALDTVQATLMAPHLTSIYVSGWQSSSTASTSNEPGPDFVRHQITRVVPEA